MPMAINFLANKDSVVTRPTEARQPKETHGERLVRAARLAGEAEGPDLGKMSREERRKALFG